MIEAAPKRPAHPHGLRILIVRTGAMGDILHGLPAVAALRQALPGCFIGWAVEPHWSPLLQHEGAGPLAGPLLDRLHLVPTREWKRRPLSCQAVRQTVQEIAALRQELRAEHYDLCIDLQGSIRSAVIGRMSGASRFFGSANPRERAARILYHQRVQLKQQHVTAQACELLGAALDEALAPAPVQLPHAPEAELWCVAALKRLGISNQESFILLAPTAGWGGKEWGSQNYAQLAQRLAPSLGKPGWPVLVNASPDHPAANLILASGHAQPLPSSLPQLIALTRRAALVIGGDTGPVHLAAALERPVVALFGPTDPARTGPSLNPNRTITLRHPSSTTGHKRHSETETGLAQITVEEVMQAVTALLNRPHRSEELG